MNIEHIERWLGENGVYNVIVCVDGQNYRINRTLGILPATEADRQMFPLAAAPDWLEALIKSREAQ